jgi:predicted esterase
VSFANEYRVTDFSGTLDTLFAADQAAAFSEIMPADAVVRWNFVPAQPTSSPSGILVFISPNASALPQPTWHAVLRARNLHWIAAEDFGNEKPTARRVLAAIMGLRLVEQKFDLDRKRSYIGGMSGGGRAASTAISTFPQFFSGALYIVGADPWTNNAQSPLPRFRANRYVFLTGRRDFNRNEMKAIYRQYIDNGARNTLLMDLRNFGHQYPDAGQLDRALTFLDAEALQ